MVSALVSSYEFTMAASPFIFGTVLSKELMSVSMPRFYFLCFLKFDFEFGSETYYGRDKAFMFMNTSYRFCASLAFAIEL